VRIWLKKRNAWGASRRIWICSCMAVSTCLGYRRGARNGYDV
jgi:hypothetical protein